MKVSDETIYKTMTFYNGKINGYNGVQNCTRNSVMD